ncbi:MAG: glutamine-hydrolyzing carbamoyl-phosphate synthase small subunit, partial [Gaiellales bacterium]
MRAQRSTEQPGCVLLADGEVFEGRSVAAAGTAFGEAVFTTAMGGYQEIVTDPSFAEQLIAFTAPMVGNYGVDDARLEAAVPAARAVVMRRAGGQEWCRWLAAQGIVALDEVDTRALTLHLRDAGAMQGAVVAGASDREAVMDELRLRPSMAGRALAGDVSTAKPVRLGTGDVSIGVLDYGCKRSIVRRLVGCGARVTLYPHDTPADGVLGARHAGVLLSNGPGDPSALPDQVEAVRDLVGHVPLLGICLGHQLLARAVGLDTYKLRFGHRGANHPVLDRSTGRVLVTSQNHGFAVEGGGPEVSHVSLYDGTVEGLDLASEQARTVQFHPEAGPGPHDAWPLLEDWVQELRVERPAL